MLTVINQLRPLVVGATGAIVLGLAVAGPAAAGGILHSVHVGSPDLCTFMGAKPGCDGNWSVTALQFDDGSVTGEFTDRWAMGSGVKGRVDCLVVDDNRAWIGGTAEYFENGKVVQGIFLVSAADNGVAAVSGEPPDQISFTAIGLPGDLPDCVQLYSYWAGGFDALPVHYVPQGQVNIR
jgi:hypothetical protein